MLDSEKYARTQELAETARDFCDKVARLNDTVATVVDAVDRQVRLASRRGKKLRFVFRRKRILRARRPFYLTRDGARSDASLVGASD